MSIDIKTEPLVQLTEWNELVAGINANEEAIADLAGEVAGIGGGSGIGTAYRYEWTPGASQNNTTGAWRELFALPSLTINSFLDFEFSFTVGYVSGYALYLVLQAAQPTTGVLPADYCVAEYTNATVLKTLKARFNRDQSGGAQVLKMWGLMDNSGTFDNDTAFTLYRGQGGTPPPYVIGRYE